MVIENTQKHTDGERNDTQKEEEEKIRILFKENRWYIERCVNVNDIVRCFDPFEWGNIYYTHLKHKEAPLVFS